MKNLDIKKLKIGVLAGGPSSERGVSLKSGKAVHSALIEKGYDVVFLDVKDNIKDVITGKRIDVAFIALHGGFGEDGTVQRELEKMGVAYTGSGPDGSYAGLDKAVSKRIFVEQGIPTPEFFLLNSKETGVIKKDLGWPLVVKPAREGSSFGLSIVADKKKFGSALEEAFKYDANALVEKYIDGKELTVGILGEAALPVVEIIPKNNVYDYTAKYVDNQTIYECPAKITETQKNAAQDIALKTHKALGLRDVSRIDMRMDKLGRLFVLEANTIPGMTERSLLPKAAMSAGISFGDLCEKMIELACKRQR